MSAPLKSVTNEELDRLIEKSKQQLAGMSPKELEKLREEQKQSFVRGFTTPCEHGKLDFEQCPKCRG